MTLLEQLKAAYESTPKATFTYDANVAGVVIVRDYEVKCVADHGKVSLPESDAIGEFIALAHNLMPELLKAVKSLEDYLGAHDKAAEAGKLPALLDLGFDIGLMGNARVALEKLKCSQ